MKGKILHKLLVVSLASIQLVVNHSLFAHENKLIFELPTERFRSYKKIDKDVSESFEENIIFKMKDSKDGEKYWAYQAIQGAFNKAGSENSKYQSIEALKHLMTYCFSLNLTQCNELSNAYEKEIQVAIKKLLSDKNESSKADILEFTMGWILFKTFDAILIRDEQGYTRGINWSKIKNLNDLFHKVYWTGEGNIKEKLLTMFNNEKDGRYDEFFRITKNNDLELFKKSWNAWLREFFVICKGKTTHTEEKSVIEKVAEKNPTVFCVFEEDAPPPVNNFSINNNNQNNNINNNTNVNNNSNNNGQINNMQNRNNNLNNNYQNKNNMNNINYNTINNNQNRNFNLNYNTNNINFNNINNMNNRNNINYNNFPQNNMFNKRNNINNSQGMNFSQNNLNYNNNPPNNLKLKKPKPLDGRTVSKGLANIGATCFMNVTLQCLSHIPELANYLLGRDDLSINVHRDENGETLTGYFKEVVKQIWEIPTNAKSIIDAEYAKFAQQKGLALTKVADYNIYDFLTAGNLGYYKPYDFKEQLGKMNPLFAKNEAGDTKDILIFILEQLHSELKKTSVRQEHIKLRENMAKQPINQYDLDNTFNHFFADFTKELSCISDNFFGINATTNVCLNCQSFYTSRSQNIPICYNFSIFNCLIMPLEEVKNMRNNMSPRYYMFSNSPCYNLRNTVTLKDCFVYNQKTDLFTGENKNYCNICRQLADSNYTSTIYSAPKILIIILNRGKNNTYNVKLDFPLEFNINNFAGQKFVLANNLPGLYELVGVVTHLGQSGPNAHFVATCRMPNGKGGCGPWYRYNDAIVSKIDDFNKDIINFGTPYVLFYRLKDGQ